jgi:hypothetical protein
MFVAGVVQCVDGGNCYLRLDQGKCEFLLYACSVSRCLAMCACRMIVVRCSEDVATFVLPENVPSEWSATLVTNVHVRIENAVSTERHMIYKLHPGKTTIALTR